MTPSLDSSHVFLATVLVAFITNALTCCAVRWFHVCNPYKEQADYYYPARRRMFVNFLTPILLLPYAINPENQDACIWVVFFGLLFYPLTTTQTIEDFFGHKHFPRLLMTERVVLFLILVSIAFIALLNRDILVHHWLWFKALVIYAMLHSTCRFARVMYWVIRRYRKAQREFLSNPDDFSHLFTRAIIFCQFSVWALWVLNTFLHNYWFCGGLYLLMGVGQTVLLIRILHPQRGPQFRQMAERAARAQLMTEEEILKDKEQALYIQKRIGELMEEHLYLRPHLTVGELADEVGCSVTDVRRVCHAQYGSFYDLINNHRIRYAQQLRQENPALTREQIATESGFGSYRTMLRAEERFSEVNR